VTVGLFVLASLALLLTPGPAVLYIVARSLEQSRRGGLVSKYVGAAYLVYLGVRRMLDRRSVVPVAGTAAQWLRARPRFLASERWISGSMYVGLGVLAAVSTSRRT